MRSGVVALVFLAVAAGGLDPRPARAVKPFLEQFKTLYVNPKTTDHAMRNFNSAVAKKDCTICHLPKPRKGFNAYGTQLKKFLNAKRDGQNAQAIRAAMKKVALMKSKPDDPDSPTFGERLRQGKLPVGEIIVRSKEASK